MRTVVGIVLAVAVGAAAGAVVVQARLNPQLTELGQAVDRLQGDLAETQTTLAAESQRKRYLEQENQALVDQVDALESMMQMARFDEPQGPGLEEIDPEAMFNMGDGPPSDAAMGPWQRGGGDDDEDATDEERAERRREAREQRAERGREMQERLQNRMDDFFEREYMAAPDRDSQERIVLMQEYAHYMAELGEAMRTAQDRDQRREVGQEMREAFGNMRQLMNQQQDAMLRNLATSFDISDPSQQEAFVAQMREVQNSPFFRPERLMMGGGGPGGGRGGGMAGMLGRMPGGGRR